MTYDLYEIEAHGIYWELYDNAGEFVAHFNTEAEARASIGEQSVKVHTLAEWEAEYGEGPTLIERLRAMDASDHAF